jgi:hypothetical protein
VPGRDEPLSLVVPPVVARLVEHHPRFTMFSADLETVTGPWAWRAEAAFFPERTFAERARTAGPDAGLNLLASPPRLTSGHSFDAGVGGDRRAGSFRLYGSVLVHREQSGDGCGGPSAACHGRTDVNLIGSVERPFARDRYRARGFVVVNAAGGSAFLRGTLSWQARDPLAVEVSGGWFVGDSEDSIGRFEDRDFVVTRLRYHF